MEVRPGYKQTEVGVIPEEWDVAGLAELFAFRNGVNADKAAYGKGTPFINVLEVITKGHLQASDIPGRVALLKSAIDSYAVRPGDVVFNRTSETQEEVGLAAVYLDDEPVVFGGFVIRGRPTTERIDATFSGYALRAPAIRSQIIARGQGAVRANIGQGDLRQVLTAIPRILEQTTIVGALSDANALIESLEQLLAKKRQIKQGAMQELLTGKRRLPGFELKPGYKQTEVGMIPEDWDGTPVRDIASPVRNAIVGGPFGSDLVSDDYVEEGVPVLRGQNMGSRFVSGNFVFVTQAKASFLEANLARPGDLVFTQRGTLGQVSLVPDQPYDRYLVSQSQMKLTVNRAIADPLFYYYAFTSAEQQGRVRESTIQTGVPHINLGILRGIFVQRPPRPEQIAIAAILSDMDAEIVALEAKLAKARWIKQGMMQELLTGRIRLV